MKIMLNYIIIGSLVFVGSCGLEIILKSILYTIGTGPMGIILGVISTIMIMGIIGCLWNILRSE